MVASIRFANSDAREDVPAEALFDSTAGRFDGSFTLASSARPVITGRNTNTADTRSRMTARPASEMPAFLLYVLLMFFILLGVELPGGNQGYRDVVLNRCSANR